MRYNILVAANQQDFSGQHNERIVNLRFKPEEASVYDPPILINPNHPIYAPHRFDRFKLI